MTVLSARAEKFTRALRAFSAGDTEGWMEIFSDDAVHEMPFAPEGQPASFEGKLMITEHIRQILSFVIFDEFDIVTLSETDDELIAELQSSGHLASGTPFTFDYVWILRYRDEQVSTFRDYMNPLQLPSVA